MIGLWLDKNVMYNIKDAFHLILKSVYADLILVFLNGDCFNFYMRHGPTKSCLKSNKLRPILNGQFYHAIFKNIGLNLFGSKQPREILVFVILKL